MGRSRAPALTSSTVLESMCVAVVLDERFRSESGWAVPGRRRTHSCNAGASSCHAWKAAAFRRATCQRNFVMCRKKAGSVFSTAAVARPEASEHDEKR